MSKEYISEKLLIKVVNDLKEYKKHLVLVGGWVPFIYRKYVWKNVSQEVIGTSDIDFAIKAGKFKSSKTIADLLKKLNYGERHVKTGKLFPYTPIVKDKKESEKSEIEFIVSPGTPRDVKDKLLGREIKLEELEYTDLLFESIVKVSLKGNSVNIPGESIFVFHKLLTFVQRPEEFKKRKDLYYSYYILRFSPNRERIYKEIRSMLKKKSEGVSVRFNIENYFETYDSSGPVSIEQANGPDYYIDDIRKDAHERISKLIL